VLFAWTSALIILASVVMFVPVRRYAIPIPLPFQLEPYRVVIVLLVLAMVVALLIDPHFTWKPVRFGFSIGAFFFAMMLSVATNVAYISQNGLGGAVLGQFINFGLLISVFFVVRQLLRDERRVLLLIQFFVWSAAVVALFAVVEKVTNVNVFLDLGKVLPLKLISDQTQSFRAGGDRSYASAQHPIALSVMLCMALPFAVWLSKYGAKPVNRISRTIVYGCLIAVTLLGMTTAVSRTAVIVIAVMILLTLALRPRVAAILLGAAIPALLIGAVALPKLIGTMIGSFLDPAQLLASQYTSAGWGGAGRLADLGPAMAKVAQNPFFGTGFGSRVLVGANANAFILDDQVLGTLLEAGAVGVLGLAIFMLVPPLRLIAFSLRPDTPPRYAHLALTCAVSCAGYIAALFFYDAFGFLQTFFILCWVWAIGAWLLSESPRLSGLPAGRARGTALELAPASDRDLEEATA
jgi:O-antigen ligase